MTYTEQLEIKKYHIAKIEKKLSEKEKQNKELQEENKKLNEANNVLYESVVKVGKRNNALVTENKTAKEIIRELITLVDFLNGENVKEPLVVKAEAFLKE